MEKQLSVQHSIQRHFSQILKNSSITVTDQTKLTETLLMQADSMSPSHFDQNLLLLTPPMSNDEENSSPTQQLINLPSFTYHGPRCWRQFRLNRSAIHRCHQ